MKNMLEKLGLIFFALLAILCWNIQFVHAEETVGKSDKVTELYQKAITEGKVSEKLYTLAAFRENYEIDRQNYENLKKAGMVEQGVTYDDWFAKVANYSAFPDGEGHSPSEKKHQVRGEWENGNRLKNTIRKGDILIVNTGGLGHAAIATNDTYILEMIGGGNFVNWFASGISDNNRQFNKYNWIFGTDNEQGQSRERAIKYWIQVWRMPNQGLARQAADWADATFWNSRHGYAKEKHINYQITANTPSLNPNYCSKLVYQAFYYGTGSAPVMRDYISSVPFVIPGDLPAKFAPGYAPYKVGTF